MKAKQLKKLLETVNDDLELVISAHDHSYRKVGIVCTTALEEAPNQWIEDYGESETSEAEYGKRVAVLLVY